MDIKRIASIIGYSDSALRKHVRKGHLFVRGVACKEDKGLAMQPKSERHERR